MTDCEKERMHLANMDNEQHFRDLLDAANRNNASFYPIDPRGLAVFDFPMGPSSQELGVSANMASLKNRIEVLRTLADATDGLAVMNTNNLDSVMKRIADDLDLVLPAGVLLDELEAGWGLPSHQRARQETGNRRASAARLPRGDGRGIEQVESGRSGTGARVREDGECGAGELVADPS